MEMKELRDDDDGGRARPPWRLNGKYKNSAKVHRLSSTLSAVVALVSLDSRWNVKYRESSFIL